MSMDDKNRSIFSCFATNSCFANSFLLSLVMVFICDFTGDRILANAFLTISAFLFLTFWINVNFEAISTAVTRACLWFLPIIKSISISPIRFFWFTIFGLLSIDFLFGIWPRLSGFPYFFCIFYFDVLDIYTNFFLHFYFYL